MERNYFIKNEAKLCSDPYGAPSADEEFTAASLVTMYADHPADVTATSDSSEQATMKITALYGTFSEPDTARHQFEYSQ
ncbi:MAG: hypothetical protein M3297_08255 [Thermoproteota archaeon]|nr:hypothetical protein [Thermoproteota archaeon]